MGEVAPAPEDTSIKRFHSAQCEAAEPPHEKRITLSDRELLTAAQKGDERAITAFAERFRPYVLKICRRRFATTPELAEDATQLTLLKVTGPAVLARLHPWLSPKYFIGRTALHVCNSLYNAMKNDPAVGIGGIEPPAPFGDPLAGVLRMEGEDTGERILRWLRKCLGGLDPDQRDQIESHYLTSESRMEIGERIWGRFNKTTYYNRLERARKKLLCCLKTHGIAQADVDSYFSTL